MSSTRPIVKYVRRKHNALIGDRTAEEIKRTVGCVYPRSEEAIMEVRGRCLMTGLPRTFTVSSSEILDALEEVSSAIVEAVHWVLERTPPELTGDISANGITMTGGGSLIWGFDKLIASKTGIPTARRGRSGFVCGLRYRQLSGKPVENAGWHDESVAAKTNETIKSI